MSTPEERVKEMYEAACEMLKEKSGVMWNRDDAVKLTQSMAQIEAARLQSTHPIYIGPSSPNPFHDYGRDQPAISPGPGDWPAPESPSCYVSEGEGMMPQQQEEC